MPNDIDLRLQLLEEKFAHQERLVDALNEVLIEQQAQITHLEELCKRLGAQLAALEDGYPGGQEPPPPHY